MAGRIPQSFINDLTERIDIADVIGPRVQLKNAGGHRMGLCPFHDEKTPSFHVYDDHYHCFGCGAHGSAIGFLMEQEGMTLPEAVESLAGMLGLEVPREGGSAPPPVDSRLYDALKAASDCYQGWLRDRNHGKQAVAYLKSRGLSSKVIKDYGLGVAPPGWDAIGKALTPDVDNPSSSNKPSFSNKSSFGEQQLIDVGLLVKNEKGRVYDRFRDRIMFPILDARGRVIGFGGRVLGDGEPKYLNSPETKVFNKGRELYGLYEARRANRVLEEAIVVEGYMDVIALAQAGISNAVATLGTAVGRAHFEKLYRYRCPRVICCFDGDKAGREAAWKAVNAALPILTEGRELRFVFLDEGEDPDSMVRAKGADHFRRLVVHAMGISEFFFRRVEEGLDLGEMEGRARLCELALPLIQTMPTGVLRTMMMDRLAERAQLSPQDLEAHPPPPSPRNPSPAYPGPRDPYQGARDPYQGARDPYQGARDPYQGARGTVSQGAEVLYSPDTRAESMLERKLLALLVQDPSVIEALDEGLYKSMMELADGPLLGRVFALVAGHEEPDSAAILGRFVGEAEHGKLTAALAARFDMPRQAYRDEFAEGIGRYVAKHRRQSPGALVDLREDGSRENLVRYWELKKRESANKTTGDEAAQQPRTHEGEHRN